MPVLPAALFVLLAAAWYVKKTGLRAPPMVTFASPTTVFSAATAVFAGVAAVAVIAVGVRTGASLLWVLIIAGAVGGLLLRMGGTTQGNRVIYERGAYRISPGKLISVVAVSVFVFLALIWQTPQ